MADSKPDVLPADGRAAVPDEPPAAVDLVALLRAGSVDAELVALLWLLIDGGVPLLVAHPPGADPDDARRLRDALLGCVRPGTRVVRLQGADETFAWLPQATELGWDRPRPGAAASTRTADRAPIRPDTTCLVADLAGGSSDRPAELGAVARLAVRAATIGYGLAATVDGDRLEDVLAALQAPPVGLTDDEASRLGVVLILRPIGGSTGPRVVAAHYVRPIARDEHGHVQRLGPAVLATWDPDTDRFEQFAWGVMPELARRVGRRAGDLELEVDRRARLLAGLATRPDPDVDTIDQVVRQVRDDPTRTPDPTTARGPA